MSLLWFGKLQEIINLERGFVQAGNLCDFDLFKVGEKKVLTDS